MRKGDIWIVEAAQPTVGTRCPQAESLALRLPLSCRIVKDCTLNFSEKYTYKGSQLAQPRRYEVADKAASHISTESRPFPTGLSETVLLLACSPLPQSLQF